MKNVLPPDNTKLLSIDKNADSIIIDEGVITICKEAFDGSNVSEVTLSEGLLELEPNSFLRAHNLKKINIPESLRIIGDYAFQFCSSLEKLTLSPNTEYLGKGAFHGCKKLEEVVLKGTFMWDSEWITNSSPLGYLKSIKNMKSYNNNFIVYDDMLFSSDKKILFRCPVCKSSVHLPEELETISSYAFYNCRYLRRVEFPKGITYIGKDAFGNCESIREIHLPKFLNIIQNDTFSLCRNLSYVKFPENISSIGKDAFFGCSKLEFFHFPDNKENEIRDMMDTSGFEYVVNSPLEYTEMAQNLCCSFKWNDYNNIKQYLSKDCKMVILGKKTYTQVDEIIDQLKANFHYTQDSPNTSEINVQLSENYQRDCIEIIQYEPELCHLYLVFTLNNGIITQIIFGDMNIHQRKSGKHSWEQIQKCSKKKPISPRANQMPCMKCGLSSEKLTWLEYNVGTKIGGYSGIMSACPNCKEEIEFYETLHYSCS